MKLLLDSHAFLWVLAQSPLLSVRARAAINAPENVAHLSQASLWEITIKASLGKLILPEPWPETLRRVNDLTPDLILPITLEHLESLYPLPLHHRDPFDRMLVAQVLAEGMTLISNDAVLDVYGVQRLW